MYNTNWHTLSCDVYGTQMPLANPKKDYTLLYCTTSGEFNVAYWYNPDDNTWGQGHYFSDFYSALEFMYQ